jgi:hypothetical protein
MQPFLGGFSIMVDVLLVLAWLVIVLAPALLASSQSVGSSRHYIDFTADDLTPPRPVLVRSRKK